MQFTVICLLPLGCGLHKPDPQKVQDGFRQQLGPDWDSIDWEVCQPETGNYRVSAVCHGPTTYRCTLVRLPGGQDDVRVIDQDDPETVIYLGYQDRHFQAMKWEKPLTPEEEKMVRLTAAELVSAIAAGDAKK